MIGFGLVPLEGTFGPLAPTHWSEVIVGLALACLIAFGVQKFVVPRFEEVYRQRSEQIEGGIRRSEQAQLEAKESKQEYQQMLEQMRTDTSQAREEARAQAAQIVSEAREQAQREADRIIEQARLQIVAERKQAFDSLRGEVGGLATTLAGQIVGESLKNDELADRTVDRFLAELETR